jgi:hypothetical protein
MNAIKPSPETDRKIAAEAAEAITNPATALPLAIKMLQLVNSSLYPEIVTPGMKVNCVSVISSYLRKEVGEGGIFKIHDLERVVFAAVGQPRVECDRRLRELRGVGWSIGSYKTDRSLLRNELRLTHIGDLVDEPGYKWPKGNRCSARVRRAIFARDGNACVICHIRAGQAYPDNPDQIARMTVGRIIPGSHGGLYEISNCQIECDRCNEACQDRYNDGLSDAA